MLAFHSAWIAVGVFIAGATSGATGIAFPLLAGPIFLANYRPTEAVALTAVCSLTGQMLSIGLLRRAITYEYRLRLILPGLLGVPLGSACLDVCKPALVRATLGAIIVFAGIWGLLQPSVRVARPVGGRGEIFVGAIGGLTAGLVGASAVAPAIWCTWCGLGKERQRAIMQPFIATMQTASLIALATAGSLNPALPRDFMIVLVPLLTGVALGVACFHVFSSATVTRSVLALVTTSGLALLLA